MFESIRQKVLEAIIRIDEHSLTAASTTALHQKTFGPYKNLCNCEKDVVLCGAGPSLQKYKPIEGAIHIAVNRAFLYDKVDFDFIFAQDYDGIKMVQKELIEYKPEHCVKMLAQRENIDGKIIPESLAIRCKALRFNMDYYIYRDGFKSKMVRNIDYVPLGGMPNVGMAAMQLALFMNPRKLYIVGCDMSGTHFVDGNQTQKQLIDEKKHFSDYWTSETNRLIKKWEEIKEFANTFYPETEIISINPVGLKGIFRDEYQSDMNLED